jgi:hypothetical protein
MADCDAVGLGDHLVYALLSDHNHVMMNPAHVDDLPAWLTQQRGLRIQSGYRHNSSRENQHAFYDGFDAVAVNDGRRLALYVRGAAGWSTLPSMAEVDRVVRGSADHPDASLLARESVGLVCTRADKGRVRIRSKRGDMLIERRTVNHQMQYRVTTMSDDESEPVRVLDYAQPVALQRFVGDEWHDSRDWLNATAASSNPDFVPQAASMFDPSLAPDIVIFPAGDWMFSGKDRGNHGSCSASDVQIVMLFAGAGIPAGGHVPQARLVDLTPTLLDLLQVPAPRYADVPMDGVSIADQIDKAAAHP